MIWDAPYDDEMAAALRKGEWLEAVGCQLVHAVGGVVQGAAHSGVQACELRVRPQRVGAAIQARAARGYKVGVGKHGPQHAGHAEVVHGLRSRWCTVMHGSARTT